MFVTVGVSFVPTAEAFAVAVPPRPSLTVTVHVYVWIAEIETEPLAPLPEHPAPLHEYVSGSPSGSLAEAEKDLEHVGFG
jgi:hypothetical protein